MIRRLRTGFGTVYFLSLFFGIGIPSALALTNTNISTLWTTGKSGWSTTSTSTPWDSTNGPNNTATITNGSGTLTVTNTGVWAGTINSTVTNAGSSFAIVGGPITFGISGAYLSIASTNATLLLSNSLSSPGNLVLNYPAGNGTLSLAGTNLFSSLYHSGGRLRISGGSTVFQNDSYGATNLTVEIGGGTLSYLPTNSSAGGVTASHNWLINGGTLLIGQTVTNGVTNSFQRFGLTTFGQVMTQTAGSVVVSNAIYGVRNGNINQANNTGNGVTMTHNISGGLFLLIASNSVTPTYSIGGAGTNAWNDQLNLSGTGTLCVQGGGLEIGGGTNGGQTVVNISGGKLLISGKISGDNNTTSALQALVWSGGAISAATIDTTMLAARTNSAAGGTNAGTLWNNGGTLSPGDSGMAGSTAITGNYVQASNGTLLLDLGGTNQAATFQNTNTGYSDYVSVSGAATLGGGLKVQLIPGYTPQFTDVLNVFTATGGLTLAFSNTAIGKSVSVDGTNGFILGTNGVSLTLSQYHPMVAPVITSQPSTLSAGIFANAQISVSASSLLPISYQWYFNSNAIVGATNASLLLTNVQTTNTGVYYAVVSNVDGAAVSSNNPLTVISNTIVISQPASALVAPGGGTTLSVTASSSLPMTYQWMENGTNIVGATNPSLTISNADTGAAGNYTVALTTAEGTLSTIPAQVLVLSNGGLSLTNTNAYVIWDSTGTGWSTAPVDAPWSQLNGRYFTAVVTNTSAYITVDPAGVTLNSLQATGSRPVVFGGGALILAGDSGSLVSPVSSSGIILNSQLSSQGNGTFTVGGSGSLVLNAGGDFSGTLRVGGGADLVISQSSVLANATIAVSDAGSAVNCFGSIGTILVNGNGNSTWGTTSGSPGSANLTASNATLLGPVVIAGPDTPTKFAYVAPNMPNGGGSNYGFATFYDGVTATNVTVNGRLDLLGGGAMNVSGIKGASNGQTNWAGGGSGAIVSGSTYASSNSAGGLGNVYSFVAGSAFSGFYLAKNTYATLTQSGSGTVSFGIFGQLNGNNTPLPSNNVTTLSGGNWAFGQLGQNNGSQMAYGTFNLTNGANATVGGNTGAGSVGMSHGFWNISSGSMTFLGNVGEAGGSDGYNNQAWDTLQITVGTNGLLSSTGNFQLGVNAACAVTNPSTITVNGGSANVSGALLLGNAANASNAVVNDVMMVTVNSGTLSVINGITVGYNSTNGLVINEQAVLTLAGGKLLSAGTINAETALNPGSTITSSFVWSGGQLSASSVTASNSFWNGTNSSIRNNTLYNTNGVLSPGDFGVGGKTTITGNYVQGSNAILDIDLGGASPATGFQSGTNTYDTVSVTGSATVAGMVRVRLAPGFQPLGNQSFTILSASGGLTANLATNTVVSSDGSAQFTVSVSGGALQLTGYTPLYPPIITLSPASTNGVIGGTVVLSAAATSSVTPLAYQWLWNGTNIPGATNPNLTLSNVTVATSGAYSVLVTNSQGSTLSTAAQLGVVYPAPTITAQPVSTTVASGGSVTFSAGVLSGDPATRWQWFYNGAPIAGATNSTLLLNDIPVTAAGSYTVSVSNSGGSASSAPATLAVTLAPPTITAPVTAVAAAVGENPIFSVTADTYGTNASYQWQLNGTNISGATNASLTLTNIQLTNSGALYSVVVSNAAGLVTNAAVPLTVSLFSPQVLGLKQIAYDYQGGQTLSAAPAPGVHPRIFFNAEDLPAIRARLTNTQVGAEAFRMCQIYTTFLRSGSSAYYAGTNNWSLTMPDGNPRISNTGFCDKSVIYNELIAGKTATLANWITTDPTGQTGLSVLSGEMTMEAFECLVKAGQPGIDTRSSNLAKAMDTWATYVLSDPAYPGYPVGRAWEFGQHQMALTYDLAYNFLSKDQRDHVRKALALMMTCLFNHSSAGPNSPINGVGYKGVGQAPESVTSNHVAIDTYKLMVACALEGEVSLADAGFDAVFLSQWFAKAMGAMHDFLTYGFYDDGGQWEGQGKNYLYAEHLIPLARRGYNFFAHPHVQAYMKRWLPAVIQPYGYSFTSYDLLGGSGYNPEKGRQFIHGGDFLGLKWMFPNDPATDLNYRNYVLTEYKDAGSGQWKTYIDCTLNKFDFHSSYYHGLIPLLAFPSDVANTNSLKQQFTDILGSLDYIEPTGGSLVSRSSFDTNAMSTVVHMRQDFGGHTFSDRNAFSITALGRLFLRFSSGSSSSGVQNGAYQNIIDIDGLEMYITPEEGDKMRIPEKVAAWTPTNGQAMFITGDTTYAYSWQWIWNNFPTGGVVPLSAGYQPEMNCFNNFRRSGNRDPLAYGDIPFVNFPQWDTPNVNEGVQSAPYNPMLQVIRTLGLVRGTNPYMLEIDDIQKDQSPHDYLWHSCVSDDLTLLVGTNLPAGCNASTDLVLQEPAATGNRNLLVRFLSEDTNGVKIAPGTNVLGQFTNGVASILPYVGLSTNNLAGDTNYVFQIAGGNGLGHLEFQTNISSKDKWTRLVHELSNSVAPGFKILFFPFTNGQSLPATQWGMVTNASGTNVTLNITIGSQTDTFTFAPRTTLSGGTNITVTEFTLARGGSNLVDYRNQIQPCNCRTPAAILDPQQAALSGGAGTIAGGTSVQLTWTNPSTNFSNILVERSPAGASNWSPISSSLTAATTSYLDTNVAPATAYDYRLAAVGSLGVSPFTLLTSVTTTQPAPATLNASPGVSLVALTWSAVPTSSSYTVLRGTVSGGPYTTLVSGLTNTAYTDPGVTAGITYYYVVQAFGSTGAGAPSAEVSATPRTPLQAWRLQYFGSTNNTGSGADTANPSGDGIPNLMKYALGLNPLSTNASTRPRALLTNGSLRMNFTMIPDASLTYAVEGTGDFSLWTNVGTFTNTAPTNLPVSVQDSNFPVSSTTRRFLRLRVTAP